MALSYLTKLKKRTVTLTLSHSDLILHAQLFRFSSPADVRPQTTPLGGGGGGEEQVRVFGGSSLPLSRLLHFTSNCRFDCSRCQVPHLVPHSSPLCIISLVQETLQTLAPIPCKSRGFFVVSSGCLDFPAPNPSSGRGFCAISDGNSDSDADVELDDENVGVCKRGNVETKSDPKDVDNVCKVIEELFALDRNMEAVLDECGVNLSHDLVVDVLERFRHARRPALRFFCWAGQRPGYAHDSRTYNKMMLILGKARQFETMVAVLEEMGERGLLTMETFEIAIKAFAEARERKKAVGMFELMKKYNFRIGVDTVNCLLDALGRAKLGKEGQLLFEKLKGRFTPNLRTYTVLLNGWCRVKNLMEAGRVWNEMIDKGFKPDIVAHHTMLEGLVRCKKKSDAIKLFEVMKAKGPSPNARSYTILIRDLCKQMKMKEAVEYFEEMIDSGCEPDAAVYTCLITGFGNRRKVDKVYGLLKEMKEKGCPPDAQTYNALIKLMTNRQMPDDAVRIYKKMIGSGLQPTIHTYNMMMKSYFQTKNYEMGLAVWEEMIQKGCCPDDNSYIVLIGGLIRQGRPEEACRYLEEMIEKGMKAPQIDYNKFAADFSRAGRPDILEELAQKMKFSGKFEVSNAFAKRAEMMKKRVKRRDHV
ncbi:pentatricopeptide repeat-containing protein At3g62470, mitochondrial-like [Diospyros lotus]|uniref:pentatricopeptide repeat-containing protein At3g62470, mitochondrial-like n=1 Tax=Diospyros lotus TaxID=55363 RepID=UPI00224C8B2F|nr:pentatricopeptide repeat-containing protein At3g62470, mitochondrial-like [Diospyros lotus]